MQWSPRHCNNIGCLYHIWMLNIWFVITIISHLMAIKELNQVNDPHILKMFIHYYILDRSFCLFFIFNCFNTPQPTFGKCKNQIQSDWTYLNIHVLSCMHVHETFLRCAGINHKTFRRVKLYLYMNTIGLKSEILIFIHLQNIHLLNIFQWPITI